MEVKDLGGSYVVLQGLSKCLRPEGIVGLYTHPECFSFSPTDGVYHLKKDDAWQWCLNLLQRWLETFIFTSCLI